MNLGYNICRSTEKHLRLNHHKGFFLVKLVLVDINHNQMGPQMHFRLYHFYSSDITALSAVKLMGCVRRF